MKAGLTFWRIILVCVSLALASFVALNVLGQQTAVVHFDLDAAPRIVDEGELIEFEILNSRYYDPNTGELMEVPPVIGNIVWNFDDGTDEVSAPDFHSSHRFSDNRVGGYEVRAKILNSSNWIRVQVENVAPEIYEISRSRPALQQSPIQFQALTRDPGIDDVLTYNWTFGDGGTGTGQTVEHTYAENGTYEVTVNVDDGDGGTDSKTTMVPVGNVGSFTVSGQVGMGRIEIERVTLAATTANPFQRLPTDPCLFRLDMFGESEGPSFTLTATLTPGIGQRNYSIGSTTEWAGMHKDEAGAQGIFFAELGLPRDIGNRNINGQMIGGPFWGRGGQVAVEYFDGNYFEMQFNARLEENIPPSFGPRSARVEGVIAMSLQGAQGEMPGAVTGSRFYYCGRDEGTFDIVEQQPVTEAVNVDFLNPEIVVTFSEPVDPNSISGNIALEYKGTSGFVKVPGSWRPISGDPKGVEFIPQARLKQGTIHCLRVRTAEDGLRGQQGESLQPETDSLFSDETRPACEGGSLEFGNREWAFSTRPEFSSAKVDVYQASVAGDGTPLVQNKPAVSRVYVDWPDPADVDTTAMVKSIPARVTVLAHNDSPIYAPNPRAVIKRPSLYTSQDKKNARNTVNFYNWRPLGSGGMSVRAKVEPLDENDQTVTEYEGSRTELMRDSSGPSLKFDYYFIKLDIEYSEFCNHVYGPQCDRECQDFDGSGGVDACVSNCLPGKVENCVLSLHRTYGRDVLLSEDFTLADFTEGDRISREGALFTTQNFPVVQTRAQPKGQITVQLPQLNNLNLSKQVGLGLYKAGWQSDANVLVGLVQPGLLPAAVGMMVSLDAPGKRVVLMEIGNVHAGVVAHEFGHFYKLKHCPENPRLSSIRVCPPPNPQVQGFRISASGAVGFNKHQIEGNQQARNLTPLMAWAIPPTAGVFINKADYGALFSSIANAPARPEAWLTPTPQPLEAQSILASLLLPQSAFAQGPENSRRVVLVSGLVTADTIFLHEVSAGAQVRTLPSAETGPYLLELLDKAGKVLGTERFDIIPPDPWHGEEDGDSFFHVVTPAPESLAAVRVSGPGLAPATRARSSAPPVVSASMSTGSGGERILEWTITDADGDRVISDVYLRAEGETSSRAVIVGTTDTNLTINPENLPPGERIIARIEASDGFNTGITEIDLGPGAPLRILATDPADGSVDVPPILDVSAWVSGPLLESDARVVASPQGRFQLTDQHGEVVFADTAYQPGTDTLTLTPVEPLAPGTRYTATIKGLQDIWGNTLSSPASWSFTTSGESQAVPVPESEAPTPPANSQANTRPPAAPPVNSKPETTSRPASTSTGLMTEDLTQSVQNHLQALGYDPGNTDGELTTATIIAISQFQAEKGLEISGEVSPQLLGILAAELDSR